MESSNWYCLRVSGFLRNFDLKFGLHSFGIRVFKELLVREAYAPACCGKKIL